MGGPNGSIVYGFRKRCWWKAICYRQGSQLIRFQSYFLSEHDVARRQITFWHETPSHLWVAGLVHLSNVGSSSIVDAVSLSGLAADNIEKIHRIKLGRSST
jgi:hypothetical protein